MVVAGLCSDVRLAACAATPPSRLWIAFQIRRMAVLRLVNFFTGTQPGMLFQISTRRLAGQLAVSSCSSASPRKVSPLAASASFLLAKAVMLFSRSILNDFISGSFDRLAVMAFITPIEPESKWILKWKRTYVILLI